MPRGKMALPDTLCQPSLFKAWSDASRVADTELIRAVRDELSRAQKTKKSLVEIGKQFGLLPPGLEDHVRHDLLSTTGWWKRQQPIEAVVREALIRSLDLMLARRRPMAVYWALVPGREASFEASIAETPEQITLIFHAPPPPASVLVKRKKAAVEESISIVKRVGKAVKIMPAKKIDED